MVRSLLLLGEGNYNLCLDLTWVECGTLRYVIGTPVTDTRRPLLLSFYPASIPRRTVSKSNCLCRIVNLASSLPTFL
jgi:hypothetical protein